VVEHQVNDSLTVSNGFSCRSKTVQTVLLLCPPRHHRAEATVLMRSLRVIQGVTRLELPWPVCLETLSEKRELSNLLRKVLNLDAT